MEDDNKFLQWLSHQKQGDIIACYGEGAKDVKEVWIARLDSNPATFQNLEFVKIKLKNCFLLSFRF